MLKVTGTFDKVHGYYRMHSPEFPYNRTTYIGYTLKQMQAAYRKQYKLQGRHIEWIIL